MSWAAAFAIVGVAASIAAVFWSFAWVTAKTGGPPVPGKHAGDTTQPIRRVGGYAASKPIDQLRPIRGGYASEHVPREEPAPPARQSQAGRHEKPEDIL